MTAKEIGAEEIRAALRRGGRIDGSSFVLKCKKPRIVCSDREWGVHRPPYLVAAYQFEPYGERWPDGTEPGDSENTSWGMREFERLSLAARAALSLRFRGGSAGAIQDAAEAAGLDWRNFPIVYAEDILHELAFLADELGPDQGLYGALPTEDQLAMRGGLQLVGFRVRTRTAQDGLRLVNARLPVSLRFIGCVFECPLLLAHCELVSLDLSGSALDTLDATGLKASGSVYLRRTLIRTPVSFSGARIEGAFDGSDVIIAPMKRASLTTPVNPDHGILNLSGATIDNEVRLDRARLWGGLSLRGAVLGRSLTMSHALIMSPMALLEKRLGDLLTEKQRLEPNAPPEPTLPRAVQKAVDMVCSMSRFDHRFAAFLHHPKKPIGAIWAKRAIGQLSAAQRERHQKDTDPTRIKALETLEILNGETDRWRALTARTLLKLSSRALTSAVRADNLRVKGSLNARAMVANGQFRMKYAEIQGAARFDGAVLRSAGHCRETIAGILKHDEVSPSPALELAETLDALRSLEALCEVRVQQAVEATARLKVQKSEAAAGRRAIRGAPKVSPKEIDAALDEVRKAAKSRRKKLKRVRDLRIAVETPAGPHPTQAIDLTRAKAALDKAFTSWRFRDVWMTLTGEGPAGGATDPDRQTYFEHRWQTGEHWSAMNLRDSEIAGDLSFGADPVSAASGAYNSDPAKWIFRDISHPVDLYGSILLDSVTTGGSLLMCRMNVAVAETMAVKTRPWAIPPSGTSSPSSASQLWTRAMFGDRDHTLDRRLLKPKLAEKYRTVQMQQAKIGRDIDLRKSVGVKGFNLENGSVGGDLKFSPKATPLLSLDADLASRFFECATRAEEVGGELNLRSAKVGGDATLVFDPYRGPDIHGELLSVQGQLEINPQVGATSYQPIAKAGAFPAADGFWLHACNHEPHRLPKAGRSSMPPWRKCQKCDVMMDAVDSVMAWKIDLSRARATVFAHPPAAWPNPGALTLDGFAYQQVSDSGPLHPRHRVNEKDNYIEHRWRRFIWRRHPLDGAVMRTAVGAFFLFMLGLLTWLVWLMVDRPWSLGEIALGLEGTGYAAGVLALVTACFVLLHYFRRRGRKRPLPELMWRFALMAGALGLAGLLIDQVWGLRNAGDVVRMLGWSAGLALTVILALWGYHYLRTRGPKRSHAKRHGRGFMRPAVHLFLSLGGLWLAGLVWMSAVTDLREQPELTLSLAPALSLVIVGIGMMTLLTTALRFVPPGSSFTRSWPFFHNQQTTPRAIEYLQRQRIVESRFKWRSSGHPVLETYIRAAKVLREAGRFVSANAVEEERLRLRTRMLSWRHHGAAKIAMLTIDLFSGYGFRLWRATLTLAAVICGVAALGHFAAAEGYLVRQSPMEAPANHRAIAERAELRAAAEARGEVLADLPPIAPVYRPACGRHEKIGVLDQDCPDFVYAADVLLPFIDLNEADRWKPTIPTGPAKDDLQKTFDEPSQSLVASVLYLWPSFVGVLGLFLTAIVGAAAATRIEAALARVEE